ncbi:putative Clathrin light chain A [Hypsibius exemplaris]|uniref:Clathrin light chain n=1 Tax=Hypsibius exemplaris TaxID=2072580 RepID=A0A1W0WL71_HYPEX|nr:putative Clathrin light chain A [Hypsibius exemplaris]
MDPFGDEEHINDGDDASDKEEEQDPAAAFLAQERDQLAGLDDEEFEKVDANGFHGSDTQLNGGMNDAQDFNGGDGIDYFANGQGAGSEQNGYGNQNQANGQSAFYEVPKIRPSTPEKIRKWREDQKDLLEKKDIEEDKKKQELRAQALHELEEWYSLQDDTIKKSKKGNRDAERDFVQQRDSDKPGEEWERVARMCDFNPKSAKGTKDVSRLRSIILQLKQEKNA